MGLNGAPLRRRNLLLMLMFVIVVPFTILFLVIGPDLNADNMAQRLAEYQLRVQYLESMYRARQEDVAVLSHYLGLVNANEPTNTTNISSVLESLSPEVRTVVKNITGSSSRLPATMHLPSVYHFLPHLLDDPNSLKPAYIMSKGQQRTGVSMVLGIPTVKRDKQSYLLSTLNNLITRMTEEERNDTLLVVFIAETDPEYVSLVSKQIEVRFNAFIDNGLIDIISPPPSYYPNMEALRITLNDPADRVKWRSKQNLDYAFLMSYAQSKGTFYVQLEDDILAKENFVTKMKDFAIKKSASTNDSWFVLDFCQLGFIGKMFKSAELPWVITFLQMFFNDKPVDWLLDCLIYTRVCSGDKDVKHCRAEKNKIWLHYNPSLFQHMGMTSSLKGKIQKLKDKQFGKVPLYYAHKNPPVSAIKTSIVPYKQHTIERAYAAAGGTFFWGQLPQPGDTIRFVFVEPAAVKHYLFRSGNIEHPEDRFYNTTVEVLPANPFQLDMGGGGMDYNMTSDGYAIVGNFDQMGVAEATLNPAKMGKLKEIRLRVQGEAENWVILNEILIEAES